MKKYLSNTAYALALAGAMLSGAVLAASQAHAQAAAASPVTLTSDVKIERVEVDPEIVQFVRSSDGRDDECLIVFGKDQLLRVRGTLDDVTDILREG